MKGYAAWFSEGSANWVAPSDDSLRQEHRVEYRKHLAPRLNRDIFPTEEVFIRAVRASRTMVVTSSIDSTIGNRSHSRSMDSLLSLIKGYRSYPKFRNEKTLAALEEKIVGGKPVDMPIVVKFPNGRMEVFAGNTRMDIAFMHGISPTVVLLDLTPFLA